MANCDCITLTQIIWILVGAVIGSATGVAIGYYFDWL